MSWAIADVANFYVSAERVFDPKLRDVPVIVLSNNDGCAIARSQEAKALHIKMGDPLFQIRDKVKRHGIELRSSNYALYADMNRRFNAVLGKHSDQVEVYSIDESFFRLPPRRPGLGDVEGARAIIAAVARETGLPIRIGLGPTRTLSKVANALAKASEAIWGGVIDLHDEDLRERLFRQWPVEEVWGIGPARAAKLKSLGIKTAGELAGMEPELARRVGTVVLERLVRELGGVSCTELVVEEPPLKATAVTRAFGAPVESCAELREAMCRRAQRAAEKIRAQGLEASRLIAFAHGSRFREGSPSAARSVRLSPATHDPRVIVGLAGQMAEAMFESGQSYAKCGVMLEGLSLASQSQQDLFAAGRAESAALCAVIDQVNGRFGRGTLSLGSAGIGARSYETQRAYLSPAWTTSIRDVPVAQ